MNLAQWITSKFSAATLPSIPLPKAPTGAVAEPSYRTVVGGTAAALQRADRQLLNSDRLGVRTTSTTRDAIRQLSYSSPDVSASIYANLRTGIPDSYTMVARNMDGGIDVPATQLAQELLRRITYLGNVDGSFGAQISLQSLSESLGRELLMYGALAGEVALDKARVPASLNAISVTKLKLYDEDKAWKPVQIVGGEELDLDTPTFIYVSLDQDLLDPYSSSPLESAQQPVVFDLDFNNDIRRALKRAVLPRLIANIDSELIKKNTPPDVLNDPNKFATYKQDIINAVQGVVNGAAPEDAFISFSEVEYAFVNGGQDPSAIIEKMQKVINSKLQTGVKTMPVVLGHGGSANTSSAESLLFLKNANIVRVKLNEFYSKAMTIAVRLMGQDCYVEFKYDSLDLRPEGELEAYKSMKQSRLLDLLSLGLVTDEEVSIALTGNLPPAGYKPLTGTMFRQPKPAEANAQPGTDASGTSAMGKTPEEPKGKAKAEIDDLLNSHTEAMERTQTQAIAAIQDMAYTVTRSSAKPVEVNVAPSHMHLTLAEAKKEPKTYVVTRDAEGMFSGIREEVAND